MSRRSSPDPSVLAPSVDPTAEATPVAPGAAEPNLEKTGEAISGPHARSAATTVIAVLLVLYTLYFARDLVMPITFAVLLSFLFSPVVRALARAHIPTPLGAGIVILALFGVVSVSAYELSGPAQGWIAAAPRTVQTASTRLRKLMRPVEKVTRTATTVASVADSAGGAHREPTVVVQEGPSLASRAFGTTQRFLAALLEIVILLYFLLAAGDLFIQKLIKVLPNLREKRAAVQIAREAEAAISTYLLTAALVNVVEGVVVTIAMYLIGMPNPELWGALVTVFEFIPYLGAAAMVAVLTVAGLTTFDSIGHALLAPAVYLAINLVQGNLVTPMLLGERLALNPVAILVGLAFWFYVWGVVGAFLAVPLLATFKIFCDHIESLASVGEFLGKRDEGERRRVVREAPG